MIRDVNNFKFHAKCIYNELASLAFNKLTLIIEMQDNRKPIVFIFGLYRSGTTLVSRLFNGDKRFASASDPVRPFFNAYSNFLRSFNSDSAKLFDPISDGFKDQIDYYSRLFNSSFSESIPLDYSSKIARQIISQSSAYSPVFSEYISSDIKEKSFALWREFLDYLIDSLSYCYADESHNALAIKEVWTLELAAPLLEYLQDRVKIIVVLRDPSDIFASSKTNAGNYPLMFISRQWRKNIAIAHFLKHQYPSQVELLQYETLCSNPLATYNCLVKNTLPSTCSWPLDKLPTPKIDNGVLFSKNSSYESSGNSFCIDTKSVGSYKSVLDAPERKWLNYFCNITYLDGLDFESLRSVSSNEPEEPYPVRDKSTVADWFNQAFPLYESPSFLDRNLLLERARSTCVSRISLGAHCDHSLLNIVNQV